MQLLLSRDAASEFEIIQMTLRWCQKYNSQLSEFLPFFNFDLLTDEEKAWVLSNLPVSAQTPSLVMNGLLQSELVEPAELLNFQLHHPFLHWKRNFTSSTDRLETFLSSVSRSLELCSKKFIIIRVEERLTLAIYIPQKLEKGRECQVDSAVRVFALPRSQGSTSSRYRVVPTKVNYPLYFDVSTFQLYERKHRFRR